MSRVQKDDLYGGKICMSHGGVMWGGCLGTISLCLGDGSVFRF